MEEITESAGNLVSWACIEPTGEIFAVMSATASVDLSGDEDKFRLSFSVLSSEEIETLQKTKYVYEGELKDRPTMNISFSDPQQYGATVFGVPEGAKVTITAMSYDDMPGKKPKYIMVFTADGTDLELSAAFPGEYLVHIEAFPYQSFSNVVRIYG